MHRGPEEWNPAFTQGTRPFELTEMCLGCPFAPPKVFRAILRKGYRKAVQEELDAYLEMLEKGEPEGDLSEDAQHTMISICDYGLALREEKAHDVRDRLVVIANEMEQRRVGCPEMVDLIRMVAREHLNGFLWEMTPGK